jgi:hypothetical protein
MRECDEAYEEAAKGLELLAEYEYHADIMADPEFRPGGFTRFTSKRSL